MSKKIVFLDIDGVVNTNQQRHEWGMDFISHRMLSLVKCIITATDAKLVLSSTWRTVARDVQLVRDALKRLDIEDKLIGFTPVIHETFDPDAEESTFIFVHGSARVREINKWLSEHPEVTHFVVIDDLVLDVPNLVLTDDDVGITEKDAAKAIAILAKP